MKDNVFIFLIFFVLLGAAILLRMSETFLNIIGIVLALVGVILIILMLKKNKKR